ncbi:MAG: PEP-CTERM system TPR-repeat protein PrsT [Acidiphilium sp.]|nr:PEP-CTERM system TPR-repeat protein PrsT [Acidiphilium sp.]MDD4935312.1 PEP-CTERM system TPR-repeat protein PrsT [Acidiphilium sp.]
MKHFCRTILLATPFVAASGGIAHANPVDRAQTYISQDKPRDAMLVLRSYLRDHSGNGPANLMLAKLDLDLGSPVSAEREARAARAAGYQPDRALSLILQSYLAQRRYIDLLHDFPIGTATGETAARLALGRAAAEQALHQDNRAAADLRKAEGFDNKLPAVWLARENVALARGDAEAAQQDIAHAKSLDPSNPQVVLSEARAELVAGKPNDAIATLNALLTRDPSNIAARITLANALLVAGQQDPAQTQITSILKLAPGSVGALYLQAGLYVAQQKWKPAQTVLQQLSPVMSDLPGAYFLQAETLFHLGENGAAQEAAAHYVARVPVDPAGRRLLAALALQNHHPHLALSTIDAAGSATAHDFGLTMLRGATEQSLGNLAQAHADFTQAATLAPENPAPLVHLGQLDLAGGNPKTAVARFQKAALLAPADPGVQAALAQSAIAAGDSSTARAAIDRLDKLKGTAAGSLLSAELDLAAFNLPAARADYEATLKAQPGNIAAMLGVAHIALLQGNEAEAETVTANAVKAAPTNQAAVSALASLLASTRNFTQTNAVLEAARKRSPGNPVFVADLASLDLRLNKLDQARTLLDGVNPAMQNDPLILAAKAQVALARHDTQGAKTDLAALVQRNPQNIGARLGLARLDAGTGDLPGAQAVLADGLKAMPHNTVMLQAQVGLALKQGGATAALAAARKLAADPAHQPESLLLPGRLYLAEHQPKQAVAAFRNADQASPSALTALNLAEAQAVSGDQQGAAATLNTAITAFGLLPSLENAAGQIALAANNLPGAAAHYQAALAKNPNDVLALNNLAWIAGKHDGKDAAGLAARAYAISPTPQIADTLGWILARQTNPKQALVLLGQAHQGMPNDPDVSYHYASVLAQTGNKTKATAILKPALAGKANFPDRAAAEKLDASLGKS